MSTEDLSNVQLHRSNLNSLEEAAAYNQMLTDFGFTHDDLASKLGKSRPVITNTLRLLNLPPSVQKRLAAGTQEGNNPDRQLRSLKLAKRETK